MLNSYSNSLGYKWLIHLVSQLRTTYYNSGFISCNTSWINEKSECQHCRVACKYEDRTSWIQGCTQNWFSLSLNFLLCKIHCSLMLCPPFNKPNLWVNPKRLYIYIISVKLETGDFNGKHEGPGWGRAKPLSLGLVVHMKNYSSDAVLWIQLLWS